MSACANCYQYIPEHQGADGVDCIEEGYFDVGYWWNMTGEKDGYADVDIYVCSQECRDELKQRVENGNWMLWRHLADLPQPSLHSSLALPDDY